MARIISACHLEMKITTVLRMAAYYRFVEPIIRDLADGGARIDIELPDPGGLDLKRLPPNVFLQATPPSVDRRTLRIRDLRDCAMHYRWVWHKRQSIDSLDHMQQHLPVWAQPRIRWLHERGMSRFCAPIYLRFLQMAEWLTPPDELISKRVKELAPDVLFACPVIYPIIRTSPEVDYVKAARAQGIPVVVQVSSWDNLTTKSSFHIRPQKVLVWNKMQVDDAVRYHGLKRKNVHAVGAPTFDKLFEGRLLEDRVQFCQDTGLDPSRPFFMWAASSRATRADERKVVNGLLAAMKAHPELDHHQLLVRPHPKFTEAFDNWSSPSVAIWRTPAFPDGDEATRGLYNCIAHSEAVIGLSTSVFLEAGALDKPCGLIMASANAPESIHASFPHFDYLLSGYPAVTQDEPDCARWLVEVALKQDPTAAERRRFTETFLRPQGLAHPSTPEAARVIRDLAKTHARS